MKRKVSDNLQVFLLSIYSTEYYNSNMECPMDCTLIINLLLIKAMIIVVLKFVIEFLYRYFLVLTSSSTYLSLFP